MIWKNLQVIRWKPTKRNYQIVQEVTLIWGQINYVIDLYVAYLFGSEQFGLALIVLAVDLVFGYIDNKLYYWMLEQMARDKVLYGAKKNGSKKKNGL